MSFTVNSPKRTLKITHGININVCHLTPLCHATSSPTLNKPHNPPMSNGI